MVSPLMSNPAASLSAGELPGRPRRYDILILDAGHKQSLASARSLGRSGLRVAMAETLAQFDPHAPLPAFRSRYCQLSLLLPDLAADEPGFAEAVLDFVRTHSPRVVLPTGDATISVLRRYREQLADLGCVLALAAEPALEIAADKDQTLAMARKLGIAQPRSIRIDAVESLDEPAAEFGFPFVLKPTISWTGKTAARIVPVDVIDKDEAREVAASMIAAGSGVLAQEWVPGRREGVTLFIAGGEVLANCGHVAHRTSPPLGGASVVRESIRTPQDTLTAAVTLARAIGLEGACEVEFRRDAANRPLLMEINPRLAGTIENAVRSGVDFPLMIWRWATGQEIAPVNEHRTGVRTRWLHGDLRWLKENWHRAGRPDSISHLRGVWTVGAEFFRSFHYDYFDRRDLKPFFTELRYTVHAAGKSRSRRQTLNQGAIKQGAPDA
jgi:predicted ATP-grasp superfamily ATP-dependent carboligase